MRNGVTIQPYNSCDVGGWCYGCGVHRHDRLRFCDASCLSHFRLLSATERAARVLTATPWARPGRPRHADPLQLRLPGVGVV